MVAQVGNEFSIPFKQVPFTVVQKNGNSVLIKGGNVTRVKKYLGREDALHTDTSSQKLDNQPTELSVNRTC